MTTRNQPEDEPSRCTSSFTDPHLQKYYAASVNEADGLAEAPRQVRALMAVHDLSHMLEGPHFLGVHEAIWNLLSPNLRPALRGWYQLSGPDKIPSATVLRDHLSEMAGERF